MDRNFYINARKAFGEAMVDNSLAVFFSGIFRRDTNDQLAYPFSVDRNFYYLTGIDRDNMILLIWKNQGVVQEYLFIPPVDEHYEKWQARMMRPNEATEISGVANVLHTYQFDGQLAEKIMKTGTAKAVYIFSDIAEMNEPATLYQNLAAQLLAKFPHLQILNPMDILIRLREVKAPEEVAEIQKAVDLCVGAMKHTASLLKTGIAEYQIKAHYIHYLHMQGSGPRFRSVVAAGKNATILHYNEARYITQPEDMVLIDAGAMNNWYVSDLTRTFPVSGKFTPRQREVYDIVLEAQQAGFSVVKAGVTEFEVNNAVKAVLADGLKKLKLINDEKDVIKYYFHSSGHPIGLDLHDYRMPSRVMPENCVTTLEPGLYIPEWSIGIRIEDNILVTKDGYVNLSAALPKSASDVENMVG